MNNIVKMTLILALVGALSGLLLTGANLLTAPVLEYNTLQQKMELLQEFFPEAEETLTEEIGEYCLMWSATRKVNSWESWLLQMLPAMAERSSIIWLSGKTVASGVST